MDNQPDQQAPTIAFIEQGIKQLEGFMKQAQCRLDAPESGADSVCLIGYLQASHHRLEAMKSALRQLG